MALQMQRVISSWAHAAVGLVDPDTPDDPTQLASILKRAQQSLVLSPEDRAAVVGSDVTFHAADDDRAKNPHKHRSNETALHLAAIAGKLQVVTWLIEVAGAPVDAQAVVCAGTMCRVVLTNRFYGRMAAHHCIVRACIRGCQWPSTSLALLEHH